MLTWEQTKNPHTIDPAETDWTKTFQADARGLRFTLMHTVAPDLEVATLTASRDGVSVTPPTWAITETIKRFGLLTAPFPRGKQVHWNEW